MANATQLLPTRRKALDHIRAGVLNTPLRILIYGAEKVGKSSFAAGAPSPVFIGAESGTERMDVKRLQPQDWQEALSWVHDFAVETHPYKTIVIDPLNWFEPMVWADLCKRHGWKNIEDAGYGKGYNVAVDEWRLLLAELEKCWMRGMNVIITAHSKIKQFNNPEGPNYDKYLLDMNEKATGPFKQWVDAILFARIETFTKIDKDSKKAKATSTGLHIMHTKPCAAYEAGSRWKLPEEMSLGWDDLMSGIGAEDKKTESLLADIQAKVSTLDDPEVTKFAATFTAKHKDNADRLAEFVNRLQLKLEEKKGD